MCSALETYFKASVMKRIEIALALLLHKTRRGIGISFQLAIIPSLYSIIDWNITTAQG